MASSLNMIAPLALLFLCSITTPGSSQGIGVGVSIGSPPLSSVIGVLNTTGSLICAPNLIFCPVSSCPPLVNATVSLILGNTTVLAQNVTNASGVFSLIRNFIIPIPLNAILGILPGIHVTVRLPVIGCSTLPTIGNLSSSVAATGGVGNILKLNVTGGFA